VRQPAGSSWLASVLLLATLCSCATDDETVFEPPAEELIIYAQGPGFNNRSPTLSRDARVLAWIRATGHNLGAKHRVVRWERPDPIDTLYYDAWPRGIEAIDLSDDGRHLVGLLGPEEDPRLLLKSEDEETTRKFEIPADYSDIRGTRWVDENTVLFGALGPLGQGVWCWNPANDSIRPICVSYPNPWEQRHGDNPDLDRSGRRVCFETRARGWRFKSLVCSVDSGEVLLDLDGSIPRFWTITPEEEDGLIYLDSHEYLRGVRFSKNETFFILQDITDYDVSPDGRWLFFRDNALNLKLRDLRDLR